MKIKNLFLATLTVMAGLTLTACGSENTQEPSTTQKDETITLNFGAMGSIDAVSISYCTGKWILQGRRIKR